MLLCLPQLHLQGANELTEPKLIYSQLVPTEQVSMKFKSKWISSHEKLYLKMSVKWEPIYTGPNMLNLSFIKSH